MWLYHYSRLDATLKIAYSNKTGSFPSNVLETRTESKPLHTFTVLDQELLGIWLIFWTRNDGNIVTLIAQIYYNGILMVCMVEEHSCKHFQGEHCMFLYYLGWFNGSILFQMKIMERKKNKSIYLRIVYPGVIGIYNKIDYLWLLLQINIFKPESGVRSKSILRGFKHIWPNLIQTTLIFI